VTDPNDPIHFDRHHQMSWEYQSYACMNCGEDCGVTEEVCTGYGGGPFELWCYCQQCDVQTFHPRIKKEGHDGRT
jgi:hypothetical protein